MAFLVILAILVIPFIILSYWRRLAARLALTLFWMSCIAAGVWFLTHERRIEEELHSVRLYPLSEGPGTHSVRVARPSQGSMKATLRGGAGPLRREDLEKLRWSFVEPNAPATWYDPREHDGPDEGETLLFYVDDRHSKDALTLQYRIEGSQAALLKGRTLAVGHDARARHLLRDHAGVFLSLFGWVLIVWGAFWMILQVTIVVSGRRSSLQSGAISPSGAP